MVYAEMTTAELREELKVQRAKEDEAYQRFTRCGHSKSAAFVAQFSAAGSACRQIRLELNRRGKEGD